MGIDQNNGPVLGLYDNIFLILAHNFDQPPHEKIFYTSHLSLHRVNLQPTVLKLAGIALSSESYSTARPHQAHEQNRTVPGSRLDVFTKRPSMEKAERGPQHLG